MLENTCKLCDAKMLTLDLLHPPTEVIIDAYVEAGLVLEKDAQQSLKVILF